MMRLIRASRAIELTGLVKVTRFVRLREASV